jgi:phage baseplate assembly protein W
MPAGTRKVYDFKSVGNTELDLRSRNEVTTATAPIGIATPLEFGGNSDGLFKMHYDALSQIKDNLKNLLLTNHGERLGLFDFGANLRPLTFELGREDFDFIAVTRIRNAVQKYMPFIELQTFEPFINHFDNREVAKVGFKIKYAIPTLNIFEQGVEVTLYVAG